MLKITSPERLSAVCGFPTIRLRHWQQINAGHYPSSRRHTHRQCLAGTKSSTALIVRPCQVQTADFAGMSSEHRRHHTAWQHPKRPTASTPLSSIPHLSVAFHTYQPHSSAHGTRFLRHLRRTPSWHDDESTRRTRTMKGYHSSRNSLPTVSHAASVASSPVAAQPNPGR